MCWQIKGSFLEELCKYHVSGQLKVAPEHICDSDLRLMGKPSNHVYEQFAKEYRNMNKKLGKKQYMVPYLMSSHPGSHLKEAIALAEYIRDLWIYAGTGTGFLSDTRNNFYMHVLYRFRSTNDGESLCSGKFKRKTDAEGINSVSESGKL